MKLKDRNKLAAYLSEQVVEERHHQPTNKVELQVLSR